MAKETGIKKADISCFFLPLGFHNGIYFHICLISTFISAYKPLSQHLSFLWIPCFGDLIQSPCFKYLLLKQPHFNRLLVLQIHLWKNLHDLPTGHGSWACHIQHVQNSTFHFFPLTLLLTSLSTSLSSFPIRWHLHTPCGVVGLIVQSRPTLCDPMDCSPPGPSVHGIFQARILGGLLFPTPGELSDSGTEPTCLASLELVGRFFITEPPGKAHRGRRGRAGKIKEKNVSPRKWPHTNGDDRPHGGRGAVGLGAPQLAAQLPPQVLGRAAHKDLKQEDCTCLGAPSVWSPEKKENQTWPSLL